jgi:hypothetical protein
MQTVILAKKDGGRQFGDFRDQHQHSVVRGLRLWSAAVVGGGKALNRKDREEHRKECKENLESSVRTERTR